MIKAIYWRIVLLGSNKWQIKYKIYEENNKMFAGYNFGVYVNVFA